MSEPINGIISAWLPEQNRIRLAVLGKLIEECNELAGRAVRCVIQGVEGIDPDTGRTNGAELTREIADVEACIAIVEVRLGIGSSYIRSQDKIAGFCRWHGLIEAAGASDAG